MFLWSVIFRFLVSHIKFCGVIVLQRNKGVDLKYYFFLSMIAFVNCVYACCFDFLFYQRLKSKFIIGKSRFHVQLGGKFFLSSVTPFIATVNCSLLWYPSLSTLHIVNQKVGPPTFIATNLIYHI